MDVSDPGTKLLNWSMIIFLFASTDKTLSRRWKRCRQLLYCVRLVGSVCGGRAEFGIVVPRVSFLVEDGDFIVRFVLA